LQGFEASGSFSPYLLAEGCIKRGSDKVAACYLPSLRRASTIDASVIARAVLTRTKRSRELGSSGIPAASILFSVWPADAGLPCEGCPAPPLVLVLRCLPRHPQYLGPPAKGPEKTEEGSPALKKLMLSYRNRSLLRTCKDMVRNVLRKAGPRSKRGRPLGPGEPSSLLANLKLCGV